MLHVLFGDRFEIAVAHQTARPRGQRRVEAVQHVGELVVGAAAAHAPALSARRRNSPRSCVGTTRCSAAACATRSASADTTAEIITAYEQRGRAAGLKAYRMALAASGLQPPDLPSVLVWGQ